MKIDDLHGAHKRPGSNLLEDKFLRVGQLQERQILRRRANEDEIVVFGVIQGKQATALDANLLMKFSENIIEGVHRQHFAHSGVMIRNRRAGILGSIVVTHANVRPADKGCVTEDDPRFLWPGEKPFPKNVKSQRGIRAIAGQPGFSGFSCEKSVRGDSHDGGEEDREHDYGSEPLTGRLAIVRQSY